MGRVPVSVSITAWVAVAALVNTRSKAVMVALVVERWVVVALFLLLALACLVRGMTVVLDQRATLLAVAVALVVLVKRLLEPQVVTVEMV
jgi:hypothetical protein